MDDAMYYAFICLTFTKNKMNSPQYIIINLETIPSHKGKI